MSGETYIDVLLYSRRKTLIGLQFLFLVIALGLSILLSFTLSNYLDGRGVQDTTLSTMILGLYLFDLVAVIFFLDYFFTIGIFYSVKIRVAGIVVFIGITLAFLFSLVSIRHSDTLNVELVSLLYFISATASVGVGVYFLLNSSSRDSETDIRRRFEEIRQKITQTPMVELKIDEALDRGMRWIINQQRDDGTWGYERPLYETSEVGRMFLLTRKSPNYSWTKVVDGVEEMRNVEQVYYLVLEALETANISETYESLVPPLFTLTVNHEIINFDDIAILEQRAKLANFSEWDFVNELEKKEIKGKKDIPSLAALGPILKYMEDYEGAQIVADIISNTFNIILSRSVKRFSNIEDDTEIPMHIIGILYNALVEMMEREPYSKRPDLYEETDSSLPNLDFGPTIDGSRITSQAQLIRVREYLEKNQEIDGSWDGSIAATSECLRALIHTDSVEKEAAKFAVYFLLAQQKPDGSWNGDIVLTSQVIKALWEVKSKIIIV